jgi:hypothetical protein
MEIITNLLSTNDRKFKVFYLINLILIKLIFIVCKTKDLLFKNKKSSF